MKPSPPPDQQDPFSGKVRYYHRSGQPAQRTWEDWIEGPGGKKSSTKNWFVIIPSLIGLIVLAAIIVGLVVELM